MPLLNLATNPWRNSPPSMITTGGRWLGVGVGENNALPQTWKCPVATSDWTTHRLFEAFEGGDTNGVECEGEAADHWGVGREAPSLSASAHALDFSVWLIRQICSKGRIGKTMYLRDIPPPLQLQTNCFKSIHTKVRHLSISPREGVYTCLRCEGSPRGILVTRGVQLVALLPPRVGTALSSSELRATSAAIDRCAHAILLQCADAAEAEEASRQNRLRRFFTGILRGGGSTYTTTIEIGQTRVPCCVLRPGDMLTVPSGWYCCTSSRSLTVSASFCAQTPSPTLPGSVPTSASNVRSAAAAESSAGSGTNSNCTGTPRRPSKPCRSIC